jgi:serine/threonine protein kinase
MVSSTFLILFLGTGDIPFRQIDWKHLDNEGFYIKDLIVKCLKMEPKERITAKEALSHQWFGGNI